MNNAIVSIEEPLYINVEKVGLSIEVNNDSELYDIGFTNGVLQYISSISLPDFSLYTLDSVNKSLVIICDGVRFYYNPSLTRNDIVQINGSQLTFQYEVYTIEIRFKNNLVAI